MRSLNFDSNKPLLYLISTPIGNMQEVSPRTMEVLSSVDLIACEDTRVTGKLLQILGFSKNLVSIREHNEVSMSQEIVKKILSGTKVAYMSDAGYPCISDPGSKLVKICLENNINVTTISGPNAALNALCASGLCENHFYFHGFLSAKPTERVQELKDLSTRKETLIFYEAPHRISKTLKSMYEVLGNRNACIARELTKKHEEYIRMPLGEMINIDPDTLIGEMVVIIQGSTIEEKANLTDNDLLEMVNEMTKTGVSTKDAIKMVSEKTNTNKNYIYNLVHQK